MNRGDGRAASLISVFTKFPSDNGGGATSMQICGARLRGPGGRRGGAVDQARTVLAPPRNHGDVGDAGTDGRTEGRTNDDDSNYSLLRAGMAALGAEYSFNSRCQEGGWCLGVEGRASLSSDEENEKKGGLARKCRRMQEGGRSGPRRFVLSKKSDDDGGRQLATGGGLWSFATPGMGAMSGNGNFDAHRSVSVTIRRPTKQSNFPGRV